MGSDTEGCNRCLQRWARCDACFQSFFLRMFGNWIGIRILLLIITCLCIGCFYLSATQYDSVAPNVPLFNQTIVNHTVVARSFDWDSDICSTSPYTYFSPFSFSFDYANKGKQTASCPWPIRNTAFRLTLCSVTVVGNTPLLCNSPYTLFAQTLLAVSTFLWIIIFVLDANSYTLGYSVCHSSFQNLYLGEELSTPPISNLDCSTSVSFIGLVFIDFFIGLMSFFTYSAWGAKNRRDRGEVATSLIPPPPPPPPVQKEPTRNPLQTQPTPQNARPAPAPQGPPPAAARSAAPPRPQEPVQAPPKAAPPPAPGKQTSGRSNSWFSAV